MNDYFDSMFCAGDPLGKQHHLLRHSLPEEDRGVSVLHHFETDSVGEAFKLIKKMSQRDLQAKFKAVYGAKTFSNNNNWLRRKLFEAIGVDPSKGVGKKPAGAVQKRRKAPKAVRPAKVAAPLHEMDHSAAEALLALGDLCAQLSEEESQQPVASGDTSSAGMVAPTYTSDGVKGWGGEDSPAADQEVPQGPSPGRQASPSPFACAVTLLPDVPQLSTGSPRQEDEGETEPAPASLFMGGTGSRANSSSLPLPALDSLELSQMATNVGQLYTWLLSRQQAAPAALLPQPPVMPVGYPLMHPGPLPAMMSAMMGGLLPGALPLAPPLFSNGH